MVPPPAHSPGCRDARSYGGRARSRATAAPRTSAAALALSSSIQLYPTPSLNCSFWRYRMFWGRYTSSGVSKALRNMYFSILPCGGAVSCRVETGSSVGSKSAASWSITLHARHKAYSRQDYPTGVNY